MIRCSTKASNNFIGDYDRLSPADGHGLSRFALVSLKSEGSRKNTLGRCSARLDNPVSILTVAAVTVSSKQAAVAAHRRIPGL
ncbi:hypothetical protein BRPE64_ACDS12250 [Caballeronia insecticola]|uniref:Uncharacterized protein n=1 Tax=Caballeronia insecticola TaxID=758793 RepID=R4WGM5_9BURK|nr:hypothetical protein BRPE64_ACDS12250 [Caballeronia insecticola]